MTKQKIDLDDLDKYFEEINKRIEDLEMRHNMPATKQKQKIRRKVVCVYGKFDDKSDFVLEPVCKDDDNCKVCKNSFWIVKEEAGK